MSVIRNIKRVMRDCELAALLQHTIGYYIRPQEDNILELHFLIPGAKGTPYEGGLYHGVLRLNPDHPIRPPTFYMVTPNGRFWVSPWPFDGSEKQICTTESSYHPEKWNPLNSIESTIVSFAAFMTQDGDATDGIGYIGESEAERKKKAAASLKELLKDPIMPLLFPDVLKQLKKGTWKPMDPSNPNSLKSGPTLALKEQDESSDEDVIPSRKKTPSKKIVRVESSDDESSEEERPVKKTPAKKKTPVKKKTPPKKKSRVEESSEEESSEEESSEEESSEEESSEEESSEEEAPKRKTSTRKSNTKAKGKTPGKRTGGRAR